MKNTFTAILLLCTINAFSQEMNIEESLNGFDEYMEKVMTDWNEPGAGVAIIYKNELVYAKGFGYRDYGNKLPVTKNTLFPIASNTKLLTAIAAGMLVEEGTLDWDKPIKESVPEIEFYNELLNSQVSLRDMLGHKTGISRHDMIWFKSDFTRKELFDRVKYLEPAIPLRQDFIYNNLMYAAVGYAIELRTGKTWEEFLQEKIFAPLEMNQTVFSIADMQKSSDYAVPYNEKRDTTSLYKLPLEEMALAAGPAGSVVSNLEDLSHWVIALMNGGFYKNEEAIAESIIDETMKPGIAFRNSELEEKGYKEYLNSVYSMGRIMEIYKGNVLTKHGGNLPGFHSQIAILPFDSIGIITYSIGDQGISLSDIIMYNLVDRLLGLEQTDWHGRRLADHLEFEAVSKTGRSLVGFDKIEGTTPTHPIENYIGEFTNEVYGDFLISQKEDDLFFEFRKKVLPLTHYHYNRFDTADDQDFGKWSINFDISPQGEIRTAVMSIDEKQVSFQKKLDASLSNPEILNQYVGTYEIPGQELEVKLKGGNLSLSIGSQGFVLVPYKKKIFKVKDFDDLQIEFVQEGDEVRSLKYKAPEGVFECARIR